MADWATPTVTSEFDDVFTELKARDDSLAKMFDDGVSWSNLPTNTIRWSSSNSRFEKWNGSTWANLSTALTDVCKTANNLSDLASASSARTNLGLGSGNSPTFAGLTLSGSITTTPTNFGILMDGSGDIHQYGAGVTSTGSFLILGGNTSSYQGILLQSGSVSGGNIDIKTTTTDLIRLSTNDTLRFFLNGAGDLTSDSATGGDIIFARPGKGVRDVCQLNVTMTGTDQAGAVGLTYGTTEITGGNGNNGCRLPPAVEGKWVLIIFNNTANGAKIYPDTGDKINSQSTNVHISVTTLNQIAYCKAVSDSQWYITLDSLG